MATTMAMDLAPMAGVEPKRAYSPHEVIARLPPFVILDRIVVPGAPISIKIAINEGIYII